MTEPTMTSDSAAERAARSNEAAKQRIDLDADKISMRITELQNTLAHREDEILTIEEQIKAQAGEEQMDQVALRNESGERNPRDIAPEDALDTIIRLENAVKLAGRRNVLIEKEVAAQQRALQERSKVLTSLRKQHGDLVSTTGYSAETTQSVNVDELRGHIEEMERLELSLGEEIKTAKVIVRKKQQLVDTLQREVEAKNQAEESLYELQNTVRVADRDVKQAEADLEDLKRQDQRRDSALRVAEGRRDVVAVDCLTRDNMYLKQEITRHREEVRNYEQTQKKQLQRCLQLQSRLDMISSAMKDSEFEKEFEQECNNALIADRGGDAADINRIFPPNEAVPAEVFELLRMNYDAVNDSLSRKDILLFEKRAVVSALEDKVRAAAAKHEDEARQKAYFDRERDDERQIRQEELDIKLSEYRAEIDSLTRSNLRLRAQIAKESAE